METRTSTEIGNRRIVVRWTTTDVTDTDANAIAVCAVYRNPNKNIPDVAEIIVKPQGDSDHARGTGNVADIFNGQWIDDVIAVFGGSSDVSGDLTRSQSQVVGEEHDARAIVDAKLKICGRRERLSQTRD